MSFRAKTIVGVALIELVLLFVLVFSSLDFLQTSNHRALEERARSSASLSAVVARDALLSSDLAALHSFVAEMGRESGVRYVRIRSLDRVLATAGSPELLERPFVVDRDVAEVTDGVFDVSADISERAALFGRVELGLSTDGITALVSDARQQIIAVAVLDVVLVAMFSFLLGMYLTRNLSRLEQAARNLADGALGEHVDVSGRDEVAAVARSFNVMSEKLRQSHDELQGALAESRRTSDDLAEKQAYLDNILGSMADILMVLNLDGSIRSTNPAFHATLGYGLAEVEGRSVDVVLHGDQPSSETSWLAGLLAGEAASDIELTLMTEGGARVPVILEGAVMRDADDAPEAVVCVARDIRETRARMTAEATAEATRAKAAELDAAYERLERAHGELREAQAMLIKASHQAGMAEIATGVLHNVGNVLTSVNVSSETVAERVRTLVLARGVEKLHDMLEAHQDDLLAYLASDGRAGKILEYLRALREQAGKERMVMLREVGEMQTSVEHIKVLIARQQAYARSSSLIETCSIDSLIAEAVVMVQVGCQRHEVEIEQGLDESLEVTTDRHKVVQILINLLSNAKNALEGCERDTRRIAITARMTGEGGPMGGDAILAISVADNGVGIPEENLSRIFTHGFSTRKNGHGFGPAQQLSGSPRDGWLAALHQSGSGSRRDVRAGAADDVVRGSGDRSDDPRRGLGGDGWIIAAM